MEERAMLQCLKDAEVAAETVQVIRTKADVTASLLAESTLFSLHFSTKSCSQRAVRHT